MTDEPKQTDRAVIYNGSLAELNSRDPNNQYRFVQGELRFMSGILPVDKCSLEESLMELNFKQFNIPYDGLVNARIYHFDSDDERAGVEGTPIVRVGGQLDSPE